MDHPLLNSTQAPLRRRMVHFLKNALVVQRSSNIVFLCGGNHSTHMRSHFRTYCEQHLPDYEVFLPEAAMGTVFSTDFSEPFDLADFEELVGAISYVIVVFPEAPGSYAETGYFSSKPNLAKKCILVMDSNKQDQDSFLSLGPAKKIAKQSKFHPNINLDYCNPHFDVIINRIRSRKTHTSRKVLLLEKFSDLSEYEIASVLHAIVSLCNIATYHDILYLARAIFRNRLSQPKVQHILSILVGAEYLQQVGCYGHLTVNSCKPQLTSIKNGFKNMESELRLSLASVFEEEGNSDFHEIVGASTNAN